MVNAQEWLDENYPATTLVKINELDISNKNLEGNLIVKGPAKDGSWKGFNNVIKFNCSLNKLTGVSWNYWNIRELDMSHNQMSGNYRIWGGVIRKINYSYNNLSKFSYENPTLVYLDISNNILIELDMLSNKNLVSLNCSNNPQLNKLFLPSSFNPTSFDSFDCRGTNVGNVSTSSLIFDCQNGVVYPKSAIPTTPISSTGTLTPSNLPDGNFTPELLIAPIMTTTAGVALLGGGITYCYINYKKKQKQKYLKQLIQELEKENKDLLQLNSLIRKVLNEKEVNKISFFNNVSNKATWLNKNCALFISKKNKKYRMWIAIYEPSFAKTEADIKLVKVAKNITQIPDEWEEEIERFKSRLERSEHPAAELYNNTYTTKLPPLMQDYSNVTKTKVKITDRFNLDNYVRKYDIVKRKIDWFGFSHHYAIYLGRNEEGILEVVHISAYNSFIGQLKECKKKLENKTIARKSHETDEWLKNQIILLQQEIEKQKKRGVANFNSSERGDTKTQITPWEYFLRDAEEIEIYHPFVPFKEPELIQKHIDVAIKTKHGEGEYHLLKDNCEHFATMCVYGLGVSQQSRMINENAKDSDYLLQAIQGSNKFFEKLEKELEKYGETAESNNKEQEIVNDNQQQTVDLDEHYFEKKIEIPSKK